ncbi:hypothetical protein L873DRAFT_1814997 [Choiromyces venosus 120613-1]|uniref:Uncharacterized protein n=1 Tax=Choiromyces venosus 120613-1 TaxID=1336337 RepID=A0A3N4J7A5_9PEZI|nr:hypothetical protein L873DRAFT_1814997 [Choiromyces venosus 120613-1]
MVPQNTMIHIISNPAYRKPSLVSYPFLTQPKNIITEQRKTYIQVSFQLLHTLPHFSPHFRTCLEPSTVPDNNPQTSLFTTRDRPTSNNLRQLTNKFHLLSSSLRNVPTIGQAGRFM